MIRKSFPYLLVFVLLLLLATIDVSAQCAMCKAALETNLKEGGTGVGRGINTGIIYIMFVPYALMTVVGIMVYRHHKKTRTH